MGGTEATTTKSRNDLMKDVNDSFYGGGSSQPTPTPTPVAWLHNDKNMAQLFEVLQRMGIS